MIIIIGLHSGVVVSTIASQQEGSRFNSRLEPFCVELARSVCSLCMRGFSPGTPASSYRPKTLIGVSKIILRSECEGAWLFDSFVSVWPCDGLATCPG